MLDSVCASFNVGLVIAVINARQNWNGSTRRIVDGLCGQRLDIVRCDMPLLLLIVLLVGMSH
jgi:hypothetical protein